MSNLQQYGSISPYDKKEDWKMYKGRLNQFLITFKLESNEQKRGALLNFCGVYELLYTLCSPDDPGNKTFDELTALLDSHFILSQNIFEKRKEFYNARKFENEDFNDYLLRLRSLAGKCNFDQRLEVSILDKFVIDLPDKIFEKVADEGDRLTLQKALEVSRKFENKSKLNMIEVNAVSGSRSYQQVTNRRNFQQSSDSKFNSNAKIKCLHCGFNNHRSDSCRFKNAICHICNKKGHMAKVCENRKIYALSSPVTQQNDNTIAIQHQIAKSNIDEEKEIIKHFNDIQFLDEIYWNSIDTQMGNGPLKFSLKLNMKDVDFLLDSGASISAIPSKMYELYFKNIHLKEDKIIVRGYGGNFLNVLGSLTFSINFNNISKDFKFFVIENAQHPILGRDFLKIFDINQINIFEISSVQDYLKSLIISYQDLFDGQIGKLKNFKAHLELKADAIPVCFKARKIPFSFLKSAEKEIRLLQSQGIIEPTDCNEWGTPLVPVLKSDGSIRLCADYKVTLNKYLLDSNHTRSENS